jgi:hypothetical protein
MRSAYEIVGEEQHEDAGDAAINALCSTIRSWKSTISRDAELSFDFDKWLHKIRLKVQRCTAAQLPQKLRAFD